VNVSFFFEGFVYFGMLGPCHVLQRVRRPERCVRRGHGRGADLGITFSMFLFGGTADKWGVRKAMLVSLCLLAAGRMVLAGGPSVAGGGRRALVTRSSLIALLGFFSSFWVTGCTSRPRTPAVRQFTTPKTAGMGYAMLYALMNLGGGCLPSSPDPQSGRD